MSRLWIGLSFAALTAGCVQPDLARKDVTRTIGGALVGTSFALPSPGQVELAGEVFVVPEVVGQIRLPPDDVCVNATAVLVDALGLNVICSATGSFSFATSAEAGGSEVAAAFLTALKRSGAAITIEGQTIVITGTDVDGSGGSGGRASGEGVENVPGGWSFVGPSEVATVVNSAAVFGERATLRVESVPGDAETADALLEIATFAELPVKVTPGQDRVYIVGPSNAVSSLLAVSRSGRNVTVPLTTAGMTQVSVDAIAAAFPDLIISHDTDTGQMFVTGPRSLVQNALPTLNRSVRSPSQIRLRAALIEFSRTQSDSVSTSLAGVAGNLRLSLGSSGNAVVFGEDLRASLDGLRTAGTVSLLIEPTLLVGDGGSARFASGDQVPILTETTESETGDRVQGISYRDTGVVLEAKVNRRTDGAVSVSLDWSITGVREDSGVAGNPVFTSRSVQSTFTVTSGQTVALGGMKDALDALSGSSVPGLPLGIFGSRTGRVDRSELIMLVTPEVVGAVGADLFDM